MSNLFNDTIVGIATALTNNAISIIRVSGDNAINIVNKVFKGKNLKNVKSHPARMAFYITGMDQNLCA